MTTKKPSSTVQSYMPVTNEEELDFTNKLHIVDELANRWWFALPPWPPVNYDYDAALARNGLRRVEVENFRAEPEFQPGSGLMKVHAVECYEGIFRDLKGNMYDLRPKETAPSLKNFQKMAQD